MKTVPQPIPPHASSFELEAAEKIAIEKGKEQEMNFAQPIPPRASSFELEAAALIAESKKAEYLKKSKKHKKDKELEF